MLYCFIVSCNKKEESKAISTLNDSIIYYLKVADTDSLSFKKKYSYNYKAIYILEKQKNDSLNRVYLLKAANRFYNMNAQEEYKKTTTMALGRAIETKDSLIIGKSYNYLGDYYSKKFISDSAYLYYFKAEEVYKKLKDISKLITIKLNKSVLQLNEKDYIGSEKSALEALALLRKIKNKGLAYDAYNLLGIIYNELREYDKAVEFHNKALALNEEEKGLNYPFQKVATLNNIGLIYQLENRDYEAIRFFQKSLNQVNLETLNPIIYSSVLNNLAYSKFKKRDFNDLPQLFYESLKIKDSLNLYGGIITCKLYLSEYYAFKKNPSKAVNFAKDAYELAKEKNLSRDILLSLKQLIDVDTKKTNFYSKEYLRINDSLQIAERKIRNKLARIEFETEELEIKNTSLVEQRKNMIYISLSILILGVLFFVIRFQATKNRELLLVQEQQKANEEIYQLMLNQQNKIEEVRQKEKKRIAQELHDGVLGKLFGTRLNLDILNKSKAENAITDREIFIEELKTIEQDIRVISHDLNSEKIAIFSNFTAMVIAFIESQRSICTAKIDLKMDPNIPWEKMDNTSKINLYRILQESFQNINKYANAKKVFVAFELHENSLNLLIQDDGVGFNFMKKKKGIGLQNMNDRITASGGQLQIESAVGQGTLLKFELPLV